MKCNVVGILKTTLDFIYPKNTTHTNDRVAFFYNFLKSLKIYMDTFHPAYAIKLSTKNFAFEDNKKIVPLYAAFCI